MNIKNTIRTPKVADAGEVPPPAKRARQTSSLRSTQHEASTGRGMKSAGGVAGGVPKMNKRRQRSR